LQLSNALRPWLALTLAQSQSLKTIANECALTDGNGVFQAQGLLALLYDPETSYDDNACDKGSALQRENSNATTRPESRQKSLLEQQLRVFPNPAQQRTLQVQLPIAEQSAKLQLCNLQGQILQTWSLDQEQSQLMMSVEGLPDGFYFLQWSDGEHTVSTKLILQ
jgi:hypothetical protein